MAEFNPDVWPASWILSLIANGSLHAFYVSRWWKDLQAEVLRDQKHRCWDCARKSPALVTQANTVHHVKPVRLRPDLALSKVDERGEPQLIALCESCHWNRHHERRAVRIPERW